MQHFVIQLNDYLGERKSPQQPTLTAYIAHASAEIRPDIQRKSIIICPAAPIAFVRSGKLSLLRCNIWRADIMLLCLITVWRRANIRSSFARFCCPWRLCAAMRGMALPQGAVADMGFSAGGHLAASAGWPVRPEEALVPIGVTPEGSAAGMLCFCVTR